MSKSPEDVAGSALYQQYLSIIELTINRRVNGAGKAVKLFNNIQGNVRDAEVTEDKARIGESGKRRQGGKEPHGIGHAVVLPADKNYYASRVTPGAAELEPLFCRSQSII